MDLLRFHVEDVVNRVNHAYSKLALALNQSQLFHHAHHLSSRVHSKQDQVHRQDLQDSTQQVHNLLLPSLLLDLNLMLYVMPVNPCHLLLPHRSVS